MYHRQLHTRLKNNYIIPIKVNNIFSMYQEQFDTSSKKSCNSSYTSSVTKSVSLIFNQKESERKFESFSDMLDHIYYLVKSLEKMLMTLLMKAKSK